MRLFVASVVCVLQVLSFPGIDSKLDDVSKCKEFFFKGKPPGIWEIDRTICQKYKNQIRYATLYYTTGRIPLVSAYKYTGTIELKIPQSPKIWMTETQLEFSMELKYNTEMREAFVKQASNEDYLYDNSIYIPGTLFPPSHAADRDTALSTFTLTNSVPQHNMFKESIWNLVETEMKKSMDNNCIDNNKKTLAYVLTGVIIGKDNVKKVNKRVNIPSYVWMAFCCYNSSAKGWVSKTYYTTNEKHNKPNNIKLKSLEELETFLKKTLKKVELFDKNCNRK